MICQGHDYKHIDELLKKMDVSNAEGSVQIACGMAKFAGEASADAVFEKADQRMYVHKAQMKNGRRGS